MLVLMFALLVQLSRGSPYCRRECCWVLPVVPAIDSAYLLEILPGSSRSSDADWAAFDQGTRRYAHYFHLPFLLSSRSMWMLRVFLCVCRKLSIWPIWNSTPSALICPRDMLWRCWLVSKQNWNCCHQLLNTIQDGQITVIILLTVFSSQNWCLLSWSMRQSNRSSRESL